MDFSAFLATYGLLAIFVIMVLKESGVPIPIPSDLIMLTAGVQAAASSPPYSLLNLVLAIVAASLIGGSVQFLIARSAGRQVIYRLGRYIGLTPARLDKAMSLLQRRGTAAVFFGLNIPGARAGIIPAAGVAKLAYPRFAPAMLMGSGVFYGWHIALGYLVGPSAKSLLKSIPIIPILLGLSLLGLVIWFVLRRRRKTDVIDTLHSWTHAACPVCLAITALQRDPENA